MAVSLKDHESDQYRWWIAGLLTAVLIARVVYIAIVPFDLIHDEAYYWDWSRQLDWCYYSKPPGIAWLIGLATRLTDSTTFFVRLPAAFISVITISFSYLLAARIYGRRAGLFAAALVCATPGNAASGVMMTIDSPFLCCWSVALYCFWRMLEENQLENVVVEAHESPNLTRIRWTLLTALAVGCGLMFKQTMLAFPLLAGSFALVSKPDRIEWKRVSFWMCAVIALLFLVPMLVWNSQHEWITFAHTKGHFDGESVSWTRRLAGGFEFLATQAGLLSPTTWLMLAFTSLVCAMNWRSLERSEQFLLWFWVGPVLAITALSFRQRIEANWPAPFYASGIVLMAGIAAQRTRLQLPVWTLQRCLAVGVISVLLTYSLPFAIDHFGLKGSPIDVVVRMWGWNDLAEEVDNRLAQLPGGQDTVVVVTGDRGVAAELAFYLPNQPAVYLWDGNPLVDSQYDIWGLPDLSGKNVLLIGRRPEGGNRARGAFRNVQELGPVTVEISPRRKHEFQLWHASGFQGWDPATVARVDEGLRR